MKKTKRKFLLLIIMLGSIMAITYIFFNIKKSIELNQKKAELEIVRNENLINQYNHIKKYINEVFYEDEEVINSIVQFISNMNNEEIDLQNELLIEEIEEKYVDIEAMIDYSKKYLEEEYSSIIEKNSEYYLEEEALEIQKLKDKYLDEILNEKYKRAKNTLSELKDVIDDINKIANKRRLDFVYDEEYNKGSYLREPKIVNELILVNKEFGLPESYAPGESYEARLAFEKMKAKALQEGIYIEAFSTYRNYYKQYDLYYNYVYNYGEDYSDTFSARPGFSEHQTGLAFDIGGVDKTLWAKEGFKYTDEAKWLSENSYKYGFILRYPEGKEWKTGYMHESWHFRYIGIEHALNFKDNNLTLEEYLGY